MLKALLGGLTITRQPMESFSIKAPSGELVRIRIGKVQGKRVKVNIVAPRSFQILRDEVDSSLEGISDASSS